MRIRLNQIFLYLALLAGVCLPQNVRVQATLERAADPSETNGLNTRALIVPPGDTNAAPEQVDLSVFYNASPKQSPLGVKSDDPAKLPTRLQKIQFTGWALLPWFLMAAGVLFLVLLIFLFRVRGKLWESQKTAAHLGLTKLPTAPGDVQTVELTDSERNGLVANLGNWLKLSFLQRLLADRAKLAEAQRLAALAVMKFDQRLSEVEKQVRLRNGEYETRIAELNKELAIAREENRELMRAKIEFLKREMAKSAKPEKFQPPWRRN